MARTAPSAQSVGRSRVGGIASAWGGGPRAAGGDSRGQVPSWEPWPDPLGPGTGSRPLQLGALDIGIGRNSHGRMGRSSRKQTAGSGSPSGDALSRLQEIPARGHLAPHYRSLFIRSANPAKPYWQSRQTAQEAAAEAASGRRAQGTARWGGRGPTAGSGVGSAASGAGRAEETWADCRAPLGHQDAEVGVDSWGLGTLGAECSQLESPWKQ